MCVIYCLYRNPERKESFMNKYVKKTKSSPISASQPVHDIPRPRPIAAAAPTHEDIARRAYEIYVEKGCPQGQSEQNWLQAEQEQMNQSTAANLLKK